MTVSSVLLLHLLLLPPSLPSWVEVVPRQTVLEGEVAVSYSIDNYDPTRFQDIHALLYRGPALLYAVRVPLGQGVLYIPCGIITHAGNHSITISYTNNTVIATTLFTVSWPVMAIEVPHRIETYTMDVVVKVSFTRNLCTPLPSDGNNHRVLQGGENGLVDVWLKVEKCETQSCENTKVTYRVRVGDFYTSHSSKVTIKCSEWGVAGVFRVIIVAQNNPDSPGSVIARSRVFYIEWSTEYELELNRGAIEPCEEGDSMVVEMNYPSCILDKDKIRLHRESLGYGSNRRRTYIGEQRVIPGDKAVIFPCSAFNKSSSGDRFCFSYISTSMAGLVNTLRTECLPYQIQGMVRGGIMNSRLG